MVDETPNLSENKIYYYVKTCSNADCKKAIAKAITIAARIDNKVTFAIDKYDYNIGFEDNEIMHDVISATQDNLSNFEDCYFNLFVPELVDTGIYDTVVVYGSNIGDAVRHIHYSSAQNIILIPTEKEEWELFCKAMNPTLIE